MPNYLNLYNNSREPVTVSFVPKTQASKVHFKHSEPRNMVTNEDGSVSFTLSTTMIDRAQFMMPNQPFNMQITAIDGVPVNGDLYFINSNGGDPTNRILTPYDLAQLDIGNVVTVTNRIIEGMSEPGPNVTFYNLSDTKVTSLEGYCTDADGGKYILKANKSRAIFYDNDLDSASLITNPNGDFGIALGVSDKMFGSELSWFPPILDWNNDITEGSVYLSLTISRPGLEDIPLAFNGTLNRESVEVPWLEQDMGDLVVSMVESFNSQWAELSGSAIQLFGVAGDSDTNVMYQIGFSKIGFGYPNLFLPMGLTESIDGTWRDKDIIIEEPSRNEPMLMALESGDSMSGTTSMEESMEESMGESMGESMTPRPVNPYVDLDTLAFVISGTPAVDLVAMALTASGQNVDDMYDMIPPEEAAVGYEMFYTYYPSKLTVHTTPPEEDVLVNLAYNAESSALDKYGSENKDFCISSAGILKTSLSMFMAPPSPPPGPSEPPILA